MIAKINDGANLYGAITYNYNKVLAGKGSILETNRIIENYDPEQDHHIHLAMRSFEPYLLANKKTSKPITHISINPDPKDKLTDEEYIRIAKDYLERMNFADQPYIIYKHEDTDRVHLHVVTTRLGEDGKKKVTDGYERIRNKAVCRELEKVYGLIPAIAGPDSQTLYEIKKVDYKKGEIKHQIRNTLMAILENYKFHSFGEYNALLSLYNIHAQQVRGEADHPYKGVIYSAMDKKGNPVGTPVKSSLLGRSFGYDSLEKRTKRNLENLKQGKTTITNREKISRIQINSKSIKDFQKALQKENMDVVFRINDAGRIYGVTFIDHNNHLVYNGSRLGKAFSANTFNNQFNNQTLDVNLLYDLFAEVAAYTGETTGNDIFGNFSVHYHGEDIEETARKVRKKKKKVRRKRNL